MLTRTENSGNARVCGLEWNHVKWTGGLWRQAVETCCESTVPHLKRMFDDKDISHVVENFRICAGEAQGSHDGTVFGDGDFYKWMEAAMYSAGQTGNEGLLKELEAYIDLIGRAQQADGYLSTKQIIGEREGNGVRRMGDIDDFEVYNLGHLFTAACLHKRVTGRDSFLKIAVKAANYLKDLYEEAARRGEVQTAVCPSHYMGLVELYRTTQDEKYLKLARLALELRDSVKEGKDDNQDRLPLKKHEKIIGHAVRANYLYAGVADLYAECGDEDYKRLLDRMWRSLNDYKIYITGGCGALYNGVSPYGNFFIDQKTHQAYGYEYQLPNITAYAETCASVGYVMWAYRMFLADPKAEYFDAIEKAMLNVNLGAVSLDGRKFFYENMLRREKKLEYEMVWPLERTEYITSYCCPPNLARVIAQSTEYAYALGEDCLWLGLYGESQAKIRLKKGAAFELRQTTEYPFAGDILFTIEKVENARPFTLRLRIPGWAKEGYVECPDGGRISLGAEHSGTYLALSVVPEEGMKIGLHLHMPARLTVSHAMVEENTNQAAVEKGPLVYCVESQDAPVESLDEIYIRPGSPFEEEICEIASRRVRALRTDAFVPVQRAYDRSALYQTLQYEGMEKRSIRLIPYYAWDNRGYGQMRIWLPLMLA